MRESLREGFSFYIMSKEEDKNDRNKRRVNVTAGRVREMMDALFQVMQDRK